jgi:hypothetical protein
MCKVLRLFFETMVMTTWYRLLILTPLMVFCCVPQGLPQTANFENEGFGASLTVDILISTLYARTDAEKEYCKKIIQLRDAKMIPNRILYGTYRVAVTKERDLRLIYFQTSLEILCKREKINL